MGVKVARTPFPRTDQKFSLGPARNFLSRGRSADVWLVLNCATTGEELDEGNDDRHYQQDMDQPAADVDREAQQPEHEQDYSNCPKHHAAFLYCIARAQRDLRPRVPTGTPTNFRFPLPRSAAQKSE